MHLPQLPQPLRRLLIACGVDPDQSWGRLLLSSVFVRPPAWDGARAAALFPHVDFSRLRWDDAIRIPLQLLWLALVRRDAPTRGDLSGRYAAWLRAAHGLLRKCRSVRAAPMPVPAIRLFAATCCDWLGAMGESWMTHRRWNSALPRWGAYAAAAPLAVAAVATPLGLVEQAAFALLLGGCALLASRTPGRAAKALAVALSLLVSARYFWWRFAFTLNREDATALLWGEALLAAELLAWLAARHAFLRVRARRSCDPSSAGPAMLFLETGSRLVFLTAPLAFLFFDLRIIDAPVAALMLYLLPHLGHAWAAGFRPAGGYRAAFRIGSEDAALTWRLAFPGKSAACLRAAVLAACLHGLAAGAARLAAPTFDEAADLWLHTAWAGYSVAFLVAMGRYDAAAMPSRRWRAMCAWMASLLPRRPTERSM
ncbi:MAG TPA: hypothetical protein VEC06_14560 [Paucimonas sp.]|nr:hypothetical protein [Paucimonas sp.]